MSNQATNSTGYGPSASRFGRLFFNGDESSYEIWEQKCVGYMLLRNLKEVITATDEKALEKAGDAAWKTRNEEAYAELIQFLDDRSLALIMRDAKDDGRKALGILQKHYLCKSKPRVITLYIELTSLCKGANEIITDYMLRAETAAAALRNNDEVVSDSLLVAMALKGLPEEYEAFTVVINQQDNAKLTWQDFKRHLRNFEETQKVRKDQSASGGTDSVMKNFSTNKGTYQAGYQGKSSVKCYSCGKMGHKQRDCRQKLWCNYCRKTGHTEQACRRKKAHSDSSKSMSSSNKDSSAESHTFAFLVNGGNGAESVIEPDSILVDCGATSHIVTEESLFVKYDSSFQPKKHFIELADGTREHSIAKKRGDAVVNMRDTTGKVVQAVLKNALFIPSFPHHIFSVRVATENGAVVTFGPRTSDLQAPDGTRFNIIQRGRLYYFENDHHCDNVNKVCDLMQWHEILGHCNLSDVEKLENVVSGMRIGSKDRVQCQTCVLGKQTQTVSTEARTRCTKPLEMVHSDLAGPIQPIAKEGFRYAMVFTDDFSGAMFVYFLKHKNDAVKACEKFFADSAPYGKVKCLRSDNGAEYTCREFQELLVKNCVKHECSAPYSPHQNGVAERSWRTLFGMARCLLLNTKLPKSMWTYAVMTAAYIRNRCYNQRTLQTPFFLLTNKQPDVSKMQVFGSVCYAYENVVKSKLDPRSRQGLFVGYDRTSPAYLVYHADTQSVKRYRCVVFDKSGGFSKANVQDSAYSDDELCDLSVRNVQNDVQNDVENDNVDVQDGVENDNVVEQDRVDNDNVDEQGDVRRNPARQRKMPKRFDDYVMDQNDNDKVHQNVDYCYKTVLGVPASYYEALKSPEAGKWQTAMEDEMQSLKDNETFEVTQLPENRQKVGGRWVYALKDGPDGSTRYKARYVAKGYSQTEGIDYQETFSPTAKMTSLRVIVQLAVQYNLIVHQLDVKTAYLNAPIDCEIFVDQPEGFSRGGEKSVWKLKKSLYGLKQSGRNWNSVLHEYLIGLGFVQSGVDGCVYSRNTSCIIYILVWVDDMVIACSDMDVLNETKRDLQARFKLSDLGVLSYFLGIEFKFENGSIKMSQGHYLKKVLCKFKMENCKPRSTVCEAKLNFPIDDYDIEDVVRYREIIGSLVYAATCTRPDLSWIVTKLSQYLTKPGTEHHVAAKHVLRYIKCTLDCELCFKKVDELKLLGYSDADWVSDVSDRRSTTGYCFSYGESTAVISWKSKKQTTVALSSCEAEYMALASATQEGVFLLQLLSSLDKTAKFDKFALYGDNQGSIALAKNPVNHQKSKHIDIKYHFLRSEVSSGRMNLVYVPTHDNVADVFTKGLGRVKVKEFAKKLCG